jgi:hypothetical protein
MRAAELALECARVEALWLPALFSLDQRCANHLNLCTALLLSPNEITDVFAIVGVVATFDLRLDPERQEESPCPPRRSRFEWLLRNCREKPGENIM